MKNRVILRWGWERREGSSLWSISACRDVFYFLTAKFDPYPQFFLFLRIQRISSNFLRFHRISSNFLDFSAAWQHWVPWNGSLRVDLLTSGTRSRQKGRSVVSFLRPSRIRKGIPAVEKIKRKRSNWRHETKNLARRTDSRFTSRISCFWKKSAGGSCRCKNYEKINSDSAKGLGFETRPDYDFLQGLISTMLSRTEFKEKSPFDWETAPGMIS